MIACQIEDLKLVNLYCPQGQAEDSPKFQYKLRFFMSQFFMLIAAVCIVARTIIGGSWFAHESGRKALAEFDALRRDPNFVT